MSGRRISAALLALVVLATIVTRLWLNMDDHGTTLGQALWRIFRYFTIWTNVLIGAAGLWLALGRRLDGRVTAGLLLAIGAVAIVYHTLLAGLTRYQGLEALVDDALHIVVPAWFALHWAVFEPKAHLGWRDIPLWLAYPAVYCAYALIRAQVDGRYPYPFLDIADKGLAAVLVNMGGLLVAFALGGLLIVGLARLLSSRRVAQDG
ncbi:MAG: hypothetical protein EP318_12075 [Rhodobacteraceae bacterium]|nr:MAG: hypothetical protein EP318_12075 [Paracoccaceae bacterium]